MERNAHERLASPRFSVSGKQAWYKLTALKSLGCQIYYSESATLEYAEPPRAPRRALFTMGSSSKTVKVPTDAKARKHKKQRGFMLKKPDRANLSSEEASVFDSLCESSKLAAFSYYYDHPHELPDRETEAMRQADKKPLKIKVKFEVDIFQRNVCHRPVPEHELDEVDPFTIHIVTSRTEMGIISNLDTFDRRTPPLDEI